jgi:hypothetical protein
LLSSGSLSKKRTKDLNSVELKEHDKTHHNHSNREIFQCID